MTTPVVVLLVLICSSAHHESTPMIRHVSLLEDQLAVVHLSRVFVNVIYPISVCAGRASDDIGTVNSHTPDELRNIDCVYLFPLFRGFWLTTINTLIGQQILWVLLGRSLHEKLPDFEYHSFNPPDITSNSTSG